MNNGRMTFRFDVNKDEPEPKTKEVDYWSSSSLATADDYVTELRQEVGPVEQQAWSYESDDLQDWDELDRDQSTNVHTASYGGAYHTRRPTYWWKLVLSVVGAVGTGLLLGYAALSFFYGDSGTGMADSLATSEQRNGAADPAGVGTSGLPITGTDDTGKNSIPVQVAAQSYYLLQYGVFSTPEGAKQARDELLTAGLAAGLDPADGNRVYAGMSSDREQAKLLSNGLKTQGIELYVREVALPGAEQVVFNGNGDAVDNYFAVSGQLLSELSGQSASLLSSGQTGTAANTSAVSDLHMQWSEAIKVLEQGVSPEITNICAELEKSMSRGISALNEYNKNKAQALLWEVQESMLSFLTSQRQLLAAMN